MYHDYIHLFHNSNNDLIIILKLVSLADENLRFVDLGVTPLVNQTFLPAIDDGASAAIPVPIEFPFWNTNQTFVYVSIYVTLIN